MQRIEPNELTTNDVLEETSLSFDARDPIARFLQVGLHMDWLKLFFLALLIYGPVEKLIIPAIGGYLNLGGTIREWTPHIEALLTGFVEFPFFLAFYLWTGHGIAGMLMSLLHNESFADSKRYMVFIEHMQAAFNQSRWSLISGSIAIVVVVLMHWVVWGPDSVVPPWFGDRLYARLLALVLIGLVAYAVAQTLIREILTIRWLQRLWYELGDDLVVHPYYADGAGGLGAVGQHTAFFFYFVMVLMLFIVMATILPSLLEAPTVAGVTTLTVRIRFWSPLIIAIWVLYFLIVPPIFYLLTWPPHQAMSKFRDIRLNIVSKQLDEQLNVAEASIINNHSALRDTLGEIKNLKESHAIFLGDFPTWPISSETRRLLGFTSIVPTAYSLLTVMVDLLL